MVTVLVFAAPSFAISLPGASDPSGPGGTNPETGEASLDPPANIGGKSDPEPPDDTIGELATDYTTHTTEVGAPAGHHIIDTLPRINGVIDLTDPLNNVTIESPGDLVQYCQDNPDALVCNNF